MTPLAFSFSLPVRFYRLVFSPWVGRSCRYDPTCSAYALEALKKHAPRNVARSTRNPLGEDVRVGLDLVVDGGSLGDGCRTLGAPRVSAVHFFEQVEEKAARKVGGLPAPCANRKHPTKELPVGSFNPQSGGGSMGYNAQPQGPQGPQGVSKAHGTHDELGELDPIVKVFKSQ